MPSKNFPETFEEQYAFDAAVNALLAAARGEPMLRVPEEQAAVVKAEHHAIVNVFQRQSDWLERRFVDLTDGLVCEYVRIKLVDRLKDNPIPMTQLDNGSPQPLHIRIAEVALRHYEGKTAMDELVQLNVHKVTCFTDGERRRFVAHFDAVHISL